LTFLTCAYLCGDVSFSYNRSDIYLRNSTIALNTPILPSTVYYESFLYIICVFPSRSQIFAHNLSSHVGVGSLTAETSIEYPFLAKNLLPFLKVPTYILKSSNSY